MAKPCVKKMLFTPTFYKKISHVDYVADWDIKQNNILFNSAAGVVAIYNIVPNFGIIRYVDFCRFKLFYIFLPIKIQSLDLCNSNLAMVPKWTSSGPSAILRVLAPAQRCARTVSDDTPAPPCTWIAMSRTLSAMFGAATCSVQHQKHFLSKIYTYLLWRIEISMNIIYCSPWPLRWFPGLSYFQADRVGQLLPALTIWFSPALFDTASMAIYKHRERYQTSKIKLIDGIDSVWQQNELTLAISERKEPCSAIYFPKTFLLSALWAIICMPRSAAPISLMQWWSLPGPSLPCKKVNKCLYSTKLL